MRALIIANPISGRGRGNRAAHELQQSLAGRGVTSRLAITRARGEARQLTVEEAAKFDLVVAVGGDGTLNEIVDGLPRDGPSLGLLPAGTANVLALELGIPTDPAGCADVVLGGHTRALNLMEVNGRRAFLTVSVGFDAAVLEELERHRAGAISKLSYIIPALKTFWRYRPPCLSVAVDREPARPFGQCFVTNVRMLGTRLLRFDQTPILEDGRAETYLCQGRSRWNLVRYVLRMIVGRLSHASDVEFRRARYVHIEAEHPVPYEVDGDFAGRTPVTIRVVPEPLRILAPPLDPGRARPDESSEG